MGLFLFTIVIGFLYSACGAGPCKNNLPPMCFPIGKMMATCITRVQNGTGLNWFQMEDVCMQDGGRLVWLTDELDLQHFMHTLHLQGAVNHVTIGLLSSPTEGIGPFWRNPSESCSYQCGMADTGICLHNSTVGNCESIGCCWINGQCQYPETQRLTQFKDSTISGLTNQIPTNVGRQCVGLRKQTGSQFHTTWETYDCSKPVPTETVFVCEYKCNGPKWSKPQTISFQWKPTQQLATKTTTSPSTPPTSSSSIPTTVLRTTTTRPSSTLPVSSLATGTASPTVITPGTSSSATIVSSNGSATSCNQTNVVNNNNNNLSSSNNKLLKVLLSVETGGATTNMSFSLDQSMP